MSNKIHLYRQVLKLKYFYDKNRRIICKKLKLCTILREINNSNNFGISKLIKEKRNVSKLKDEYK